MGRKDARPTPRKESLTLPLTPQSNTKVGQASGGDTDNNMDRGMATLTASMAETTLKAECPPELRFKSWREGTFITKNFLPPGAPLSPFPTAKVSQLRAESPAFVPAATKSAAQCFAQSPVVGPSAPHTCHLQFGIAPTIPVVHNRLIPTGPKNDPYGTAPNEPCIHTPEHFHEGVDPDHNGRRRQFGHIPEGSWRSGPSRMPSGGFMSPPESPNMMKLRNLLGRHSGPIQEAFAAQRSGSRGYGGDDYGAKYHSSLTPTGQLTHPLPPIPPYPQRTYLARADPKRRDVEVSATGIHHNLARMVETHYPDGTSDFKPNDDFNEPRYNLIEALENMGGEEERKDFWECNWVEIMLDFRSEGKDHLSDKDAANKGKQIVRQKVSVIDMIRKLGPELPQFVKNVYVVIKVPAIGLIDPSIRACIHEQKISWAYKETTAVVAELDNFIALQKFEIIIHTPSHTPSPLCFEQLNYVLPFYDLYFQEWELKWKAEFMTDAEPVQSWPISYLDREMHKIWLKREAQAAHQQSRGRGGTFGSLSEGGEWADNARGPRLEDGGRRGSRADAEKPDKLLLHGNGGATGADADAEKSVPESSSRSAQKNRRRRKTILE